MEIGVKHKSTVLETRRIRLREIQTGDIINLFTWRNTEKFRFLLHYNTEMISYEEFCGEFIRDSEAYKYLYLVEKKESGEPVGFTYVNAFSEKYKSCFINLFIDEPFEKKGYGVDAFVLFCLFLFQRAGLKKLFAQAFDFNNHSLSCMRNIGMRELTGNVTRVTQRGNLLCFAADESIISVLTRINKILSCNKPK